MHYYDSYHLELREARDLKYPITVKTEAQAVAVQLADVKEFFKEDRDVENSLITSLVEASQITLENYTGFKYIDTVYQMDLEGFVDFKIPKQPYQSGSLDIKYDDADGVEQTLSSDNYTVYRQEDPVSVDFKGDLPSLESNNKYPIRVTFTIGYGTDGDDVPENLKTAIKLLALIYWKRDIPVDDTENLNPLNIRPLKALIGNRIIGRFK